MFIINYNKKKFVLRSVDINFNNELNDQCKIANSISNNNFIKPILNNKKKEVLNDNNKCWIMNEWIDGKIYDGNFYLLIKTSC